MRTFRFARRSRGALALAVVVPVLALTGCFVPQSRKDEADAKASAAYAQCDELLRAGQYKSHLAAVNCAVPTVVAAYEGSGYPFTDLIYLSIEARRVGADRVDAGEVSDAQYRRDLAVLATRLAAEDKRRREIMEFGGDPRPAPAGTLLQGLSAFAPAPALPATAAGTRSGCIPIGDLRSCK